MSPSAFEVFNLKASFKLDEQALETAYYKKSRELHPDRVARGDKSTLLQSQEKSAELNRAYQTLRDPELRLEALLRMAGHLTGETPNAKNGAVREKIPIELAEEFFELQESAMEDPTGASDKIHAFIDHVTGRANSNTETIRALAARIDWEHASSSENDALIRELLSRRKERSYLLSMAENARKLGAAPGE